MEITTTNMLAHLRPVLPLPCIVQLASFMSELESSGLLKDEHTSASAPPGESPFGTTDADPGSLSPTVELSSAGLANPAAAIVYAVTGSGASDAQADGAAAQTDQSDAAAIAQPETNAQASGDGSEAGAGDSGADASAEQRVLGELQGAPQWREVHVCQTLHCHCCILAEPN